MTNINQKLFIATGITPQFDGFRFGQEVSFPRDWKDYPGYCESAEKLDIEWGRLEFGLVANTIDEAREKAETTLKDTFGELCDRYCKEKADKYFNVKQFSSHVSHVHWKKYIALNCSEQLYITLGFNPIGAVISYKEIVDMVQDKKLPKIFVDYPELIPQDVFIPSFDWKVKHPDSKEIHFQGENLTDGLKKKIAEGLFLYEQDERGLRHNEDKLSYQISFVKHLEIFPEDISFWVYNKKDYFLWQNHDLRSPKRFIPMTYFPYEWKGGCEFNIGTAEQIKEFFHKRTLSKIKAHERSIKSLSKSLVGRLKIAEEAPLGLCVNNFFTGD